MRILETVISNTANSLNGVKIISEQHDTSKIAVDASGGDASVMARAGVWLRDGKWDTCEMGISQEEAQRRYDAANTPEAKEAFMVELRERAMKRASLDNSTGRVAVMVAGQPAWHGLGVNVAAAASSSEAIRLASQNWRVAKTQLRFADGTNTLRDATGTFGLYREDTNAYLGTVGSRYQVIQNADAYEFLDSVIGEYGAKYHTAGSVFGGQKVWMQVELPRQAFEVVKGDKIDAYALFTNSHDGKSAAMCMPTSNRVVCNNTLRIAVGSDRNRGINLRHTGNIKAKINDAKSVLGLAVKSFDEFKANAEILVQTPCVANVYFGNVLDEILEVSDAQVRIGAAALTQAQVLDGIIKGQEARDQVQAAYQRAIDNRNAILEDMIARYEGERCGIGGIRGTAWAALQAVTEHADHGKRREGGSKEGRDSRRFESVLIGERDEMKQVAYQQALALAN